MFNPYIFLTGFGHLIADLSQGVLPIITPILAAKMNLSFSQVGLMALMFTFSSAIIQPLFGIVSDKYNLSWLMPIGIFASGAGLAATGIAPSFPLLLLTIGISGIGVAAYHPEGSKLAHYVSNPDNPGASMSIFSVGGNIGFGLGPLWALFLLRFSGLESIWGMVIPGTLVALLFLYLLPRINRIVKNNRGGKGKEANAIKPYNVKNPKAMMVVLVLFVTVRSWIHAGLIYFIPFYFPEFKGYERAEMLVSVLLLAGILGTLLGGPIADRFGGRAGLLGSMVISLLTLYPFIHFANSYNAVLAFVIGAGLISTFSTTVVFGQRLMPEKIGLASGLMLGFAVGMGSVGVTLLGIVADHMGLAFAVNILCFLPILGIALAFFLPKENIS